jgi:ubiquinone/menaquinone biosynthesis C-methylase UbiE
MLLCVLALAAAAGLPAAAAAQHGRLFDPKDLGLLEGPDRDAYQKPEQVMDALRIGDGSVVADLGAGGGWFTVRLARRVGPNGRVYAEDVQPQMIEAITRRVQREGLRNVVPRLGTHDDPKLPARGVDVVLMVDTYNEVEARVALLKNIALALNRDGRLGIVNFKKDGGGPGPSMDDRVDPDVVIRDAQAAGLRLHSRETFLRYQYFLVFERAAA